MGIEPTLVAWEATVLPLNYTRDRGPGRQVEAFRRVGNGTSPTGAWTITTVRSPTGIKSPLRGGADSSGCARRWTDCWIVRQSRESRGR
jgi:hypothetical protein